jgi:hypothetical protein
MKTKLESDAGSNPPVCSGLECLSVWLVETIRWDAHHERGNHSEAYIVAKDIKAVWKWLAIDLSDEGVEIRSITNKAPVLAVIPNIQNDPAHATGTNTSKPC